MRWGRAAPALLLALLGCAHASGGSAPPSPRLPVALMEVTGLPDAQRQVLESAVCQGLVEANQGDVTCPDSVRSASELLAQRQISGQDTSAEAQSLISSVQGVPRRVRGHAEEGEGRFALVLELYRTADEQVLARREVAAPSFDELAVQAQQLARELLR